MITNIVSSAPLEILEVNDGKDNISLKSPEAIRHSYVNNNTYWVRISLQGAKKMDACFIKVRCKRTSKIWKIKPGRQNTNKFDEIDIEMPIIRHQSSQISQGKYR